MENQKESDSKSTIKTLAKMFAILLFVYIVVRACAGNEPSTTTSAKPTLDWDKSSYAMQYDAKNFATYPKNYTGDKIAVKCEVFNIISESQFQCWTDDRDPIGVITREDFSNLYEDDAVTVYGIGSGEACGKNAFGAKVCQALIAKAWYTKP